MKWKRNGLKTLKHLSEQPQMHAQVSAKQRVTAVIASEGRSQTRRRDRREGLPRRNEAALYLLTQYPNTKTPESWS